MIYRQKHAGTRVALLIAVALQLLICGGRTTQLSAQGVETTPLTRLGYGSLSTPAPVAWRGMGGVGIAMSSPTIINLQNPAAYGATDSLSFLLDIGASAIWAHNKDGQQSKNALLGGLDYLALQFPIYKDRIAISTGIVPFSSVGYNLHNTVELKGREEGNIMLQSFQGRGSLQSLYLGIGAEVYRGLRFGVNAKYHFGRLTHTVHLQPSAQTLSQDFHSYNIRLDDWGVDLGAQYKATLPNSRKDALTVGVTYTPQMKIRPEMIYFVNRNYGSTNKPIIEQDTLHMSTATPHKIGLGLAWDIPAKMTIAADVEAQLWGLKSIPNPFINDKVTLTNSYRAALGVQFTPDTYSRKYHERMYYRWGANYQNSYISTPELGQLHEIGASFGIGMPMRVYSSDRTSTINLTLEYTRRFSTVQKSFSQDMLKLSLSLNFNETWFRKLKIQ